MVMPMQIKEKWMKSRKKKIKILILQKKKVVFIKVVNNKIQRLIKVKKISVKISAFLEKKVKIMKEKYKI